MTKLLSFVIFCATALATVNGIDTHEKVFTKDELIALTRDHLGRIDPDDLLNGFFPVWAMIQFMIACFFLVIAVISTVCFFLGCKTPAEQRRKKDIK